jgi:chemotaxis protein histidine kinase CheA
MDFREYATKEAAELVEKLAKAASAGAQAAVQRVADEAKARLDAVQADLKARNDRLKELEAAHEEAHRQARDAEAAHAATHADLKKKHDAARAELQTAREQFEAAARGAEEKLRDETQAAQQLRHQVEALQQKLRADAQAAQAAQEQIRLTAHTSQEKLRQELQAKIDAAVAAQARAADLAKSNEAQLRAARAQVEAARAELDASRVDLSSADGHMERLLVSFEGLAGASNITDLLIALAETLATEFKRVALFRLKGNKLQGEYQTGFDLSTDVGKVVIPLSMDSLLARAVTSGCIETMEADNPDAPKAPFGGSPSCALALPVAAGGETLGILYADDGPDGNTSDPAGARGLKGRYAELLLRHTVALALRLTAELRNLAELRGHASRLLNHAEEMYVADVEAGTHPAELKARLLENVECARRLYAQRVAIEGPAAANLLEDQLVQLVEQRVDSQFGRDLASIVDVSAGRRAEAS